MDVAARIVLVALIASFQTPQPSTLPKGLQGVWFATGGGSKLGVQRIEIRPDGVMLTWRDERVSCTPAPAQERIAFGDMSAIVVRCPVAAGAVDMGLTGPTPRGVIVHVVAPGMNRMLAFLAVHGSAAARRDSPSDRPAGRPAEAMPQFPWPPPQWTSRTLVPNQLTTVSAGEPLGTVFDRLVSALKRGGIDAWSVFAVGTDGIAIVARLENIDDNGRPTATRWQGPDVRSPVFSLGGYLKALFSAQPGRYRVIAFVVTARAVTSSGTAATRETMDTLLSSGAMTLPESLRNTLLPAGGHCEALVYEFFRRSADESPRELGETESTILAREHLIGAGLWKSEDLNR